MRSISSTTGRLVRELLPKSSWTAFTRNFQYWTYHGWSSPYSSSMRATASGVARSPRSRSGPTWESAEPDEQQQRQPEQDRAELQQSPDDESQHRSLDHSTVTAAKLSLFSGPGTYPEMPSANATAGWLCTYGTPGTKSAMSRLASW